MSIEDFNCLILLSFKYSEKSEVKVFYDSIFKDKGFFNEVELDPFFSSLKEGVLNFKIDFLESRLHGFFKFLFFLCGDEKCIYNESFDKLLMNILDECNVSISRHKGEFIIFEKNIRFCQEESEKVLKFSQCELNGDELSKFEDGVEKNISYTFLDGFSFSESEFKGNPEKLANYFGFLKGKVDTYSPQLKGCESHILSKTTMLKEFDDMRESIPLTSTQS